MAKKDEKKEAGTEESGTKLSFAKIDDYVTGVSGSGKRTKNNGDAVATCLNGMTLDEVISLASRMKAEHRDYSQPSPNTGKVLNVGMQRMNIGNAIRKAVNALEKAEEGSGIALLDEKSRTIRAKADKRLEKVESDRKEKAAAAAEKKAEKDAESEAA